MISSDEGDGGSGADLSAADQQGSDLARVEHEAREAA